MSEFIVHTIPGSPFGRAVQLALEEKGAAYSLRNLSPGDQRSPEHMQRHPFGRVPVLEHGDFRLYETQAILRYVMRWSPARASNRPIRARRPEWTRSSGSMTGTCSPAPGWASSSSG